MVQITRGGATKRTLTYDSAGNVLTDAKAGSTTTYSYNAHNRLASATSGALVWGYTYNGLEQLAVRALTTGGTDVTHFMHDIWGNVLAETGGGEPTGATALCASTSGSRGHDRSHQELSDRDRLFSADQPSVCVRPPPLRDTRLPAAA